MPKVQLEPLKDIGLSESQAKVYLSLVQNGLSTVVEIADDTGVHRTNIYDMLKELREKGLANYVKQDGVQQYKATKPRFLLDYIKEKEERINKLMPQLEDMYEEEHDSVVTEVYKGKQGMKYLFKDRIKEGEPILGYSVAGQLRKNMPTFAKQHLRDFEDMDVTHRYLYAEGVPADFDNCETKRLPREFASPVAIEIYGPKVLISIWKPSMVGILIKSKQIADAYKQHFEFLWELLE